MWIVRHACDTLNSDDLQDQQNRRGSCGELLPLRFPHQNRAQPRVMFCPGSWPARQGWALSRPAYLGQLRGLGVLTVAGEYRYSEMCLLREQWFLSHSHCMGLPRWLSGKVSACQAADAGLNTGSRRSPGEGNGKPLWYSCLENPMD